ncbi:MAG TPA: energy transducer TonB [Pyrinomonadaceae bacterium]|nr:energy transducer TonB [Pyrinomonadaceae bacterium]
MSRAILVWLTAVLCLISAGQTLMAQTDSAPKKDETCDGPIYKAKEVTKRAKVTRLADPDIPFEVLSKVKGIVQIRAAFCKNGKVTNIEVIRGLPYGVTDKVIEAALKTKFKPAEKDGHPVSQYFVRELKLHVD